LLIGAFFSLGICLIFKHFKFLNESAITETFLMWGTSLMAYWINMCIQINGIGFFGVNSIFLCSLIHSHYTWYNLSPQGKATSAVIIGFFGCFFESILYAYIGISFYNSIPMLWSFSFIGIVFGIIIVCRFLIYFSMFAISKIGRKVGGKH
jgi:NhaP-type Na+/H+ or K+/H+ antiporter